MFGEATIASAMVDRAVRLADVIVRKEASFRIKHLIAIGSSLCPPWWPSASQLKSVSQSAYQTDQAAPDSNQADRRRHDPKRGMDLAPGVEGFPVSSKFWEGALRSVGFPEAI